MVLPKLKIVFEKNQNDLKIMANVLQCIERTLDKLDKLQVLLFLNYQNYKSLNGKIRQIIDEVLPLLYDVRLSDPEIILRVVRK